MKLIDFLFGWIALLWPSRKDTHVEQSHHDSASRHDDYSDDSDAHWTSDRCDSSDDDDADSWEVEEDMDHCYFDHDDHDDFDMF